MNIISKFVLLGTVALLAAWSTSPIAGATTPRNSILRIEGT
jgi:hypothetical protein